MIKIENITTVSEEQWNSIIMGCRNPLNSWEKSDSWIRESECWCEFQIGEADMNLMKRLANAGSSDHRKFARMIPVWMDVTAPLYWWKEADQYKVGTVTNSCSTMHKIQEKEFVRDDFSWEHLFNWMHDDEHGEDTSYWAVEEYGPDGSIFPGKRYPLDVLDEIIFALNYYRNEFIETKDKRFWWQMIQLLPSSYNQKRTWFLNYEVLWNIYQARKNHKLDEWRIFCETIVREIPYFAEIFGIEVQE